MRSQRPETTESTCTPLAEGIEKRAAGSTNLCALRSIARAQRLSGLEQFTAGAPLQNRSYVYQRDVLLGFYVLVGMDRDVSCLKVEPTIRYADHACLLARRADSGEPSRNDG